MAEFSNGEPVQETADSGTTGRKKGSRRFFRGRHGRLLPVVLVVVIAVCVWAIWKYYSVRITTDDAQTEGHISPVSARVSGTVLSVKVEDNQLVTAGTLLAVLDPRDYQVALVRARADLAAAKANYEAARAGVPVKSITTTSQVDTSEAALQNAREGVNVAEKEVDTARARLLSSQAKLRESESAYEKADQDLQRYRQLIVKNEVSRQQYDNAVTAVQSAAAARDSAHAMVDEAEKQVGAAQARLNQSHGGVAVSQAAVQAARTAPQQVNISKAQADSANARVQQAEAEVQAAHLNLDYASVIAPVSGWVTNKTVQIGQQVQPGQILLAIIPREDLWVIANYKETELKRVRPGQVAEVLVDALSRTFRGRVDSIAAATGERFSLLPPENASGNYVKVVQRVPVKITLDPGQDPEHLLRVGLSVEATVLIR